MTYGEKKIQKLETLNFTQEIDDIATGIARASMPPRLPREEAFAYYNRKLRKAFFLLELKEEKLKNQKPKVISLY